MARRNWDDDSSLLNCKKVEEMVSNQVDRGVRQGNEIRRNDLQTYIIMCMAKTRMKTNIINMTDRNSSAFKPKKAEMLVKVKG